MKGERPGFRLGCENPFRHRMTHRENTGPYTDVAQLNIGTLCRKLAQMPRRRAIDARYFFSDWLTVQLFQILEDSDPWVHVYVYQLIGDKPVKPALYKGEPFPDLLIGFLQEEQGGGRILAPGQEGRDDESVRGVLRIATPINDRDG